VRGGMPDALLMLAAVFIVTGAILVLAAVVAL
jgi:hypothetical protein